MALPLTILDMHRLIEQNIQKMGFFAYRDMEPEEIDLQINGQINLLIEGIVDKFFGRKPKVNEEQGFQKDQVSLDNLRNLHVRDETRAIATSSDEEISFTFPNAYRHHIRTLVSVSYDCYTNGKKETTIKKVAARINKSQVDWRNHPYYKTGKDSPLAEVAGNSMFIYKDETFDITGIKLSYIKDPAVVKYAKDGGGNYDEGNSVHCDLDKTLHYMVVDMTSIRIMKILEGNPQKIVNLESETI
jgi:hypothetical protein